MLSHARTIPELILLGSTSSNVKRLPVFSFLVRHPRGMFLHHNFVCAILNDVFGVQAQGGCACADQYAYDLMGINETLANEYKSSYSKRSDSFIFSIFHPPFCNVKFTLYWFYVYAFLVPMTSKTKQLQKRCGQDLLAFHFRTSCQKLKLVLYWKLWRWLRQRDGNCCPSMFWMFRQVNGDTTPTAFLKTDGVLEL